MPLFVDSSGSLRSDSEILESFLTDIKEQIEQNADLQGRNATGKAKRSLRVETGETSGKLIDGAGYVQWGWEYGRAPGRMPPRQAIEEWIEAKGIIPKDISVSSLAFLIARKIGQSGTKLFQQGEPSGVITDAVTPQRVEVLGEAFGTKYGVLVASEIVKYFNNA